MKVRTLLFVSLALVLLLSMAACGAMSPRNTGTVPAPLQTIEAGAEDIIDFVPSGNWDKAGADVTAMTDAWAGYQDGAEKDGASQELQDEMASALDRLQMAVQSQDAAATMQASNDVSAAVVELFALFDPQIPADIGRLDVLERQIILDVDAQHFDAAMKTLNTTKTIWEKVKPSVLEHDGKDVSSQFEASLATQESALDAGDVAALTHEARLALELVDELENVFR